MEIPNIQPVLDALKPAVDQAVSAIGMAGSEAWRVGILKQYADGAGAIVVALLILGSGFGVLALTRGPYKAWLKEGHDHSGYCDGLCLVPSFVGHLAPFVGLAFSLPFIHSAILHFIVPEWMLVQEALLLAK